VPRRVRVVKVHDRCAGFALRPAAALRGAVAPDRTGPLGESWRAWTALAVGVLAITAHSALSIAVSVLMKPMLADFAWARSDFAFTMTVRMLAMIAVVPFAGQLTDRIGARPVLATGALLMSAGIFLTSQVHSFATLAAVSIAIGVGQACVGSVAASALVLRLFRHRRGLAVGVLNGGDNLLNSAVPIAAAALLPVWGWRGTLGAFGGAYLILALVVLAALDRRDGRTSGAGDTATTRLRDLPWRDGRLWTLLLVYAAIYAYITSIQLHFHAFQTDLGRSPDVASRLLSTQILVGALGAPLFGAFAERTSVHAALVAVVGGLAATSVITWTATGTAAFGVWAVLHGLVNSGTVALLALVLHELFDPRQIGRLMGVASVACMSATILGNQFTAWTFDTFRSYRPAWQVYTALLVCALIPVLRLRRRAASDVATVSPTGTRVTEVSP
jgi:MFS family permease